MLQVFELYKQKFKSFRRFLTKYFLFIFSKVPYLYYIFIMVFDIFWHLDDTFFVTRSNVVYRYHLVYYNLWTKKLCDTRQHDKAWNPILNSEHPYNINFWTSILFGIAKQIKTKFRRNQSTLYSCILYYYIISTYYINTVHI